MSADLGPDPEIRATEALERIAASLERAEKRADERIRLLSESVNLQKQSRTENSEIADAIKLTALPTGWRCWEEKADSGGTVALCIQRPDGSQVLVTLEGA